MCRQSEWKETRGFTLIEVTFATGILFLGLVLLLGGHAQLAGLRDLAERRHLATQCLSHCVQQVQQSPVGAVLAPAPPEGLPGDYKITVEPLAGLESTGAVRITVRTFTQRGHEIKVSAPCLPEGLPDGP